MKIAVIMGGISPERNVSLNGGRAVYNALKNLGHEVVAIDPAKGANCVINIENLEIPTGYPSQEELASYSKRDLMNCVNSPVFDQIEFAFPVIHGNFGEDGLFQSLLELRGIPYAGSKVKASAIAMDKLTSKLIFSAIGLMTPAWKVMRKENIGDFDFYETLREELGKALVIKAVDQGSSIGLTVVADGNIDDIHQACLLAAKYSDVIIVEEFIEGAELTVGIVGGQALPVIEIVPEEGFYDYEHKYTKGMSNYICPAELTENDTEFIQHNAELAFRALGCSGYGRVDFRLDYDHQPYVLEVNTLPGFTELSLVPMAAKEIGLDFENLCQKIIEIEMNNYNGK